MSDTTRFKKELISLIRLYDRLGKDPYVDLVEFVMESEEVFAAMGRTEQMPVEGMNLGAGLSEMIEIIEQQDIKL